MWIVLRRSDSPINALQIRRSLPKSLNCDKKVINSILYDAENHMLITQSPPVMGGKSQKPLWELKSSEQKVDLKVLRLDVLEIILIVDGHTDGAFLSSLIAFELQPYVRFETFTPPMRELPGHDQTYWRTRLWANKFFTSYKTRRDTSKRSIWIVEDNTLSFDVWSGNRDYPGSLGKSLIAAGGIELLLQQLKGQKNRKAVWKSAVSVAVMEPGATSRSYESFVSQLRGSIAYHKVGKGNGYSSIFVPPCLKGSAVVADQMGRGWFETRHPSAACMNEANAHLRELCL
jgi:hypothetical protein